MFILPASSQKHPAYYSSGTMFNNVRSENQSNIDSTNTLVPLTGSAHCNACGGSELSFSAPEGVYEARDCLTLHNPTAHPADPQPATVNPLAPTSYLPQTFSSGVRLSVTAFKYTPPPGTLEANSSNSGQYRQPLAVNNFSSTMPRSYQQQQPPQQTPNSRWKPSFFGSSSNNRRNSALPSSSAPRGPSPLGLDERQNDNKYSPSNQLGNSRVASHSHSKSLNSASLAMGSLNINNNISHNNNNNSDNDNNNNNNDDDDNNNNNNNDNNDRSSFICRQPTGIIGTSVVPPNAIGSNPALGNLHVFIPLDPHSPNSSNPSNSSNDNNNNSSNNSNNKKKKQKHSNLIKNSSSFLSKTIVHDNLSKRLNDRSLDAEPVVWVNMGRSLQWLDYASKPAATTSAQIPREDMLSKIFFIRSHPLCHDVNPYTRSANGLDVVVGMSTGDVLWLDSANNRYARLNKNGDVTRSPVTGIKWVPGSENLFFTLHANGALILFDKDREDGAFVKSGGLSHVDPRSTSSFRIVKSLYGDGENESGGNGNENNNNNNNTGNNNGNNNNTNNNDNQTNGIKHNPVAVYKLSHKPLTSIEFSPDRQTAVITSTDGYLRFLNLATETLSDVFPSYFGGILCCAFSPDGKYLATGGEDDLVNIWSVRKRSLVARGHGHRSWVRRVEFDGWNCDTEFGMYRVGSVGDEGNLIFWDFSSKTLSRPKAQNQNQQGQNQSQQKLARVNKEKRQASVSASVRNSIKSVVSNALSLEDQASSSSLKPMGSSGGFSINTTTPTTTTNTNTNANVLNNPNTTAVAAAAIIAGGSIFNTNPLSTTVHPFVPKYDVPQLTPVATLSVKFDFAKYLDLTSEGNNNGNNRNSSDGNVKQGTNGNVSGTTNGNAANGNGNLFGDGTDGQSFHAEGLSDIVFLEKIIMVASKDGRIWTWNRPKSGGVHGVHGAGGVNGIHGVN